VSVDTSPGVAIINEMKSLLLILAFLALAVAVVKAVVSVGSPETLAPVPDSIRNVVRVPASGNSNSTVTSSYRLPRVSHSDTWKTYSNTQYGFEVKYPGNLIVTTGDGPVIPPVGPDYVSGTPSFWFGTISITDIESAAGKPHYAALVVMPTQCIRNYWANPAISTSTLVINGITMEEADYSASFSIFTFAGSAERGWSSRCNTIEIMAPPVDQTFDEPGPPEVWDPKTYKQMLSTFRFTD
jgi:hypothetical protein